MRTTPEGPEALEVLKGPPQRLLKTRFLYCSEGKFRMGLSATEFLRTPSVFVTPLLSEQSSTTVL